MKIRIKSGDCPAYLTVGKVYEAKKVSRLGRLFTIINDSGDKSEVFLIDCAHLNGGSWEIVNEEA